MCLFWRFTCVSGTKSLVPPEVLKALLDWIDWGVWQLIFTAELERSFEGSTEEGLELAASVVDNMLPAESVVAVPSILPGNKNAASSEISPWTKACGGCTISWLPNKWALLDGKEEYWYVLSLKRVKIDDMSCVSRLFKLSNCLKWKLQACVKTFEA